MAGLSVLTHTHTPPARSSHALFTHAGNTILLSTTLLLLTHIQFCILSISCSPSRRNGIRVPPHAQEFPGFTPVVFFCGFVNSVAVSFTHGLIRGFYIVVDSHTGHETINSSPLWFAYVFPSSIGCAKWVVVPHVIGNMYADAFWRCGVFPLLELCLLL